MAFPSTEQRTYTTTEVASIVRGNLLMWGATAIVFCAVPSALIFIAIPKFDSLFGGFGADLPATTTFLLEWRYLLWVMPVLVLALLGISLSRRADEAIRASRPTVAAIAVAACASLLAQGFAVVALYAPIFRLGAVI